jgi:hypothetical protein
MVGLVTLGVAVHVGPNHGLAELRRQNGTRSWWSTQWICALVPVGARQRLNAPRINTKMF